MSWKCPSFFNFFDWSGSFTSITCPIAYWMTRWGLFSLITGEPMSKTICCFLIFIVHLLNRCSNCGNAEVGFQLSQPSNWSPVVSVSFQPTTLFLMLSSIIIYGGIWKAFQECQMKRKKWQRSIQQVWTYQVFDIIFQMFRSLTHLTLRARLFTCSWLGSLSSSPLRTKIVLFLRSVPSSDIHFCYFFACSPPHISPSHLFPPVVVDDLLDKGQTTLVLDQLAILVRANLVDEKVKVMMIRKWKWGLQRKWKLQKK